MNANNFIHAEGRITADPIQRDFSNGGSCCDFCIAIDRNYKSKDGSKVTDFLNCRLSGNRVAAFMKYFHKGDPVSVIGELRTEKAEHIGVPSRTFYTIAVDDWSFVQRPSGNAQQQNQQNQNQGSFVQGKLTELQSDDMDNQLPF